MLKLMGRKAPGKRLVLGFDGGCLTCSELAKRIEGQVGDKLEVMSLHDLQLVEWRERALGKEAPWVPTLFEVNGTKVRAWTEKWRFVWAVLSALSPPGRCCRSSENSAQRQQWKGWKDHQW